MDVVAIVAWIVAAVVAVVVLGFAAYEISWKSARLRRDLGRLQGLDERLGEVRAAISAVQRRIAAGGLR